MKWYYVEGKKSVGPMEESHLHVLVKGGQLRRGTPVYSERLSGWTPYAQAFSEEAVGAAKAPVAGRLGDGLQPGRSSGQGPRGEIVKGRAVGAGVVLILGVLLTFYGVETRSGNASQDGISIRAGAEPGQNDPPSRGPSRRLDASGGASRPGRSYSPPTGVASARDAALHRSGFDARTDASNPVQVSRASILGQSLRKDEVGRILEGKTMQAIQSLLGVPDEIGNTGVEWRYTRGVRIYDPGADLTFFAVRLEFGLPLQRGGGDGGAGIRPRFSAPGIQQDYAVRRINLLPFPTPQRGRVESRG